MRSFSLFRRCASPQAVHSPPVKYHFRLRRPWRLRRPDLSPFVRALSLAGLILALCLALSGSGLAQTSSTELLPSFGSFLNPEPMPGLEGRDWRLTASEVRYDQALDIVEAEGDVLIKSRDEYLKADFARYYRSTGWVFLSGNVEGRQGPYYLEAEQAEIDLTNEVGWLNNGKIYSEDPLLTIAGERIRRTGPNTYEFEEARVTACEGVRPAWALDVSQVDVTAEDVAVLKHPRLKVLGVPLLYFPYLSVSTVTKRKTGLLFPGFGSSSRLGGFYRQPIYVNINPENDVTLYESLFSKRGFQQGVEWRSTPDVDTDLTLLADWIRDSETAETEAEESTEFSGDGLARPNTHRYWLRGKYDGHLPSPLWKVKADIDYVSDQNYLREFDIGELQFDTVRNNLLERFGRDMDVKDSLQRTSGVLISREYDDASVHFGATYTQNLEYMNNNEDPSEDPTVQRLPEISAFAFRQTLANLNTGPLLALEGEADSSLTYLWRRYGDTAVRLDATPRLALPMEFGPVSVIPTAGVRQTVWAVNKKNGDIDSQAESLEGRLIPEAGIQFFSEFQRVYSLGAPLSASEDNVGNSVWTRLKHSVQPRLTYALVGGADQEDLPDLDKVDRSESMHELRYSLENVLSRKRSWVDFSRNEGNILTPQEQADYQEFLRIRLQQAFSFEETGRNEDLDEYPRMPLSDILFEVISSPGKYISLISRTYLSVYGEGVTEHEHSAMLSWPDRGWFSATFDFLNPTNRYTMRDERRLSSLTLRSEFSLARDWLVHGAYRYDFHNEDILERTIGITYRHYCYDLGFEYTDDGEETRFTFRFALLGLSSPSFGF